MNRKKLKALTVLTALTVAYTSNFSVFSSFANATERKGEINNEMVKSSGLNLALNKPVVASASETSTFTPEKVTDGNLATRWSSGSFNSGKQWIYIDLEEVKEFDKIRLHWEGANAKDYKIEVSNDASEWTQVYRDQDAPGGEEIINFDTPQNARYVRVYCEKNNPSVWTSVSLYEIEIYNGELPMTAQQIADSIQAPVINKGDTKMPMPVVQNGAQVELIGADYEQIIDANLNVHQPLIDTTVIVDFKVTKDSNVAETKGIEVVVPGKYTASESVNEKPDVVPSMREWVGHEGNFEITDSSRIIIDSKYENELSNMAGIFKDDYKDILGKDIGVVVGAEPTIGDFYFTLDIEDKNIGNEGYYLNVGDYVRVEAVAEKGAFYSTRSILQILKQTETSIAKGIARDIPRYENRGFFLDIGRKYFDLEFVKEYSKLMSWYKMNDFQLHLNDNEIWFYEDYENWQDAYSAFRLESETYPELTSKDGSYTKEEFGALIDEAKKVGVEIIPEIDTPAHSLAFTKLFPELRQGDGKQADHLNVEDPAVYDMLNPLFDEYLKGDNPTFRNQPFHIGVDEYTGNNEKFREYSDHYLEYTLNTNRTPRLWGSFTARPGSTPVRSEGVEMNIWNIGWADPRQAINEGYDIINTDDSNLYIVPEANYYRNYLNTQSLYNNWAPNTFNGSYSYKIPAGHPQLKGGTFAIWNDLIGARQSGASKLDIHDRAIAAMPTLAEKMWSAKPEKSYDEFKDIVDNIGDAPNTNVMKDVDSKTDVIMQYSFDELTDNKFKDASGNDYDAQNVSAQLEEGKIGSAIRLNGNSSFIDTPVEDKGPNYTVSMWVKKDANGNYGEQILAESSEGSLKAVQKETGNVGFSRENLDFSFDYKLPEGEWVELTFVGQLKKTSLYVNGALVDTISKPEDGLVGTFIFPLDKIGSQTKAFEGLVDEFKIVNQAINVTDPTVIPQSQMRASSTSEQSSDAAINAIDGDESTVWHTKWSGEDRLPQSITLNLGGSYDVNKLSYQPRQSGTNGNITKYEIQTSEDGTNFTKVSEGTLENNTAIKKIEFDTVKATHVRLVALEGVGGYASAAELNVHQVAEVEEVVTGSASMSVPSAVRVFEDLNLQVGISELEGATVKAAEFVVEYDANLFDYKESSSNIDGVNVMGEKVEDGKVKVLVDTENGELPKEAFATVLLTAKSKSEGTLVRITDAKITAQNDKKYDIALAESTVTINESTLPVVKPNKPTGFKAENVTGKTIDLTWEAPTNTNIKEYIIYKDGKEVARTQDTNYTVDGLKANTLYGFKVVAVGTDDSTSSPVSLNVRTEKESLFSRIFG
ncbi:MAG: discoidin domain-containing protein [Sarcina sp.]